MQYDENEVKQNKINENINIETKNKCNALQHRHKKYGARHNESGA